MNEQELSETITGAIGEIKQLRQERDELFREVFRLRTRAGLAEAQCDKLADIVGHLNSIRGCYARVSQGPWRVREWTKITSLEEIVGLLSKGYVVHLQAWSSPTPSDTSGHKEPPL